MGNLTRVLKKYGPKYVNSFSKFVSWEYILKQTLSIIQWSSYNGFNGPEYLNNYFYLLHWISFEEKKSRFLRFVFDIFEIFHNIIWFRIFVNNRDVGEQNLKIWDFEEKNHFFFQNRKILKIFVFQNRIFLNIYINHE